ncbi:hypothetical protein [Microtetraspora glauca]|uniref:Uncharacterized protein n=1 Tax=Microtetraspora glauca TaxID=1996 RepID=A0ABV3G607_MICGL
MTGLSHLRSPPGASFITGPARAHRPARLGYDRARGLLDKHAGLDLH